jgi:hypothetical protein
MNQFEGLLLLSGLSFGLVLAGYWLAALIETGPPAVRLAVAPLAGLATLLFMVSAVNFFQPLAGFWAGLCLAPVAATLLWPEARRRLGRDLASVARTPGVPWLAGLATLFLLFLLWPMLSHGGILFYDGTTNHDSFFWISAAEHLKRHAYMEPLGKNATQPLTNAAIAITTLQPAWGRMGAEGLLALASAISWTSPIKLYLYATACLLVPWLGGVYLAVRTFYAERLPLGAKLMLVAGQPIFIFFYSNANLPNLLGALTGAAAVVATEQILRDAGTPRTAFGWWCLLGLSLHGLYCSYPEMVPFVLLPGGLLWLRGCLVRAPGPNRRALLRVAVALLLSLILNPATVARAVHGFIGSFNAARANENWANVFAPVPLPEFLPALGTLCIAGAHFLGPGPGAALTVVLVAGSVLAWRRAGDRFGAVAVFAGSFALAGYTVATNFSYGWQKTVQFAGVFFAAALPCALVDAQIAAGRAPGLRRWLARAGLGLTVGLALFATVMSGLEIHKWSERKVISRDWFQLRELSHGALRGAPVLVETASFRMSFFYSMWSAYFLPESRLYFGERGDDGGGYLHPDIIQEGAHPVPPPRAFLVGRDWADSFDADSPRLRTGLEYALLEKCNRVTAMQGVFPLNGVPDFSSRALALTIRPHTASTLVFQLKPRDRALRSAASWRVTGRTEGGKDFTSVVAGPPPWQFKIPLTAGQPNRIAVTLETARPTTDPLPFAIDDLRVENQP